MSDDLKCSVEGCGNKAAGYLNGTANADLKPTRIRMPTVNAAWCREHQEKLFLQTLEDSAQTNSELA
jgi:hypothetical protein